MTLLSSNISHYVFKLRFYVLVNKTYCKAHIRPIHGLFYSFLPLNGKQHFSVFKYVIVI